jgi:hypothetical protein
MKTVHKRPSYASVMSTIAVFLVLGGGVAGAAFELGKNSVGSKQLKRNAVTAAKIKNNAVTAEKVQDGSLLSSDFKAGQLPSGAQGPQGAKGAAGEPATKLFAAVDESGALVKGSGVVSSVRTTTGFYNVVFNKDISKCVYVATVGDDTFSAIPAILSTNPLTSTTVRIRATSDAGAAFDRPFYLAVLC